MHVIYDNIRNFLLGPDEEIPVVHPQTNDEKMMKLEKCFGGDSCTKCCGACTILKKNLDQFKHRPGTDPAKLGKTRVLHDEVCAAAGHPAYTITLAGPTGCVCTGHLGDLQEDEFAAPVGAVGAAALPGWHSESPKHAEMKAKANGEGGDRHSAYGRLCFRDLEEENYVMDTMHAAIHMRKDVCELLVDGALQFDLQQETLEELVDNGKGVTTVLIGTVTVPELQAGAHEPGKMCGPESKFFLAIFERIFTRWKLAKPHDADLDAFITCLRRGKKTLNDVLDLLLSRNTEAAFGLSLHTRLKAKAEAFANWLLDDVQTRRSQHGAYIPGGIKSGNVRCKQAVHNLVTHFVDLALHWWTEYGILIGVFSTPSKIQNARPRWYWSYYDSQYTRDMCDVGDGTPPSRKNTTVVTLCRRLLQEAVDCGVKVIWVKVRGHSTEEGNDRADGAATAGQNGRKNGVLRLDRYITEHLGHWT